MGDPRVVAASGPHPTSTARTDPVTSALAEREHTATGHRGRHVAAAVAAVEMSPGRTAKELHALYGMMDRHEWSRRLPDAEAQGLIERGLMRKCAVAGRMSMTWWPKRWRSKP